MKVKFCGSCQDFHEHGDWYLYLNSDKSPSLRCKKGVLRRRAADPEGHRVKERASYHRRKNNPDFYPHRKSVENQKRYLEEVGDYCKRCKKTYPFYVYEMHHIDPSERECKVQWHRPWKSIEDEIAKCVLLCANCHKIKHYELQE